MADCREIHPFPLQKSRKSSPCPTSIACSPRESCSVREPTVRPSGTCWPGKESWGLINRRKWQSAPCANSSPSAGSPARPAVAGKWCPPRDLRILQIDGLRNGTAFFSSAHSKLNRVSAGCAEGSKAHRSRPMRPAGSAQPTRTAGKKTSHRSSADQWDLPAALPGAAVAVNASRRRVSSLPASGLPPSLEVLLQHPVWPVPAPSAGRP